MAVKLVNHERVQLLQAQIQEKRKALIEQDRTIKDLGQKVDQLKAIVFQSKNQLADARRDYEATLATTTARVQGLDTEHAIAVTVDFFVAILSLGLPLSCLEAMYNNFTLPTCESICPSSEAVEKILNRIKAVFQTQLMCKSRFISQLAESSEKTILEHGVFPHAFKFLSRRDLANCKSLWKGLAKNDGLFKPQMDELVLSSRLENQADNLLAKGRLPYLYDFFSVRDLTRCRSLTKASSKNDALFKWRVRQLDPALHLNFTKIEKLSGKLSWAKPFKLAVVTQIASRRTLAVANQMDAIEHAQNIIRVRVLRDAHFTVDAWQLAAEIVPFACGVITLLNAPADAAQAARWREMMNSV